MVMPLVPADTRECAQTWQTREPTQICHSEWFCDKFFSTQKMNLVIRMAREKPGIQ
jgi:hypothetical protein